jgi:hypothetical protein
MGKASRNFFRGPRLLVGCSASDNDSYSSDDDVYDIHRTEPTYCWYFILMQIAALFTCTIFRNDSKIVGCWNLSYRATIHLIVTEYCVVICILLVSKLKYFDSNLSPHHLCGRGKQYFQ